MPALPSPHLQRRRFAAILPFLQGGILDLERRFDTAGSIPPSPCQPPGPGIDFRSAARRLRPAPLLSRGLAAPGLKAVVIEFLQSLDRLLGQNPAHLNPGGRLVFTKPTRLGLAVPGLGPRLGLFHLGAARGHKQFYDRASLLACVARSGLQPVACRCFCSAAIKC